MTLVQTLIFSYQGSVTLSLAIFSHNLPQLVLQEFGSVYLLNIIIVILDTTFEMGEITFPVSQTFCDRLCDFFKWIVCSDNSVSKTAIDCVGNTPNDFNKSPCTGDLLIDDGYLILACIANNPVLNSKLCCYEPLFSSSVKIRVFSETVSSWSLALKRRRLERSCREEPFVRYDMAFVNNELKNMWQKRSDEVKLFEEGQFVVDDKDVDGCCLTRSPSPCRSNSTLSSAYSSEELSTVSSASQYSCLFTSEMSLQEEAVNVEAFSDMQLATLPETPACNLEEADYNPNFGGKLPSSNDVDKEQLYLEDARVRGHIERAFKYCKLFEILEQPCNRFRISPSSCGLGLPLAHLDRCWPSVSAVGLAGYDDQKEFKRRLSSSNSKKQRRGKFFIIFHCIKCFSVRNCRLFTKYFILLKAVFKEIIF